MIELAKLDDILVLENIIDEAKTYMKENNIDQWQDGYPNADTLKNDIAKNQLYALKDEGKIIGLFAMIDYEKTYEYIEDGKWGNNDKYLAIHRVAIKKEHKGKGYVKEIFDYAKRKCEHLRIDTHKDNLSMQRAIVKNGFIYCGIIYLESGAKRLAYEYCR